MNIKFIMLLALTCLLGEIQVKAQSCRDLYREAVSLQKEGKLDKAKAKFQQVVACGDQLYFEDSRSFIAWIERIQRKYDPVKPFAVSDNEIVIPHQGGQDVITVDGNGSWQARIINGDNGWCKIKKEKGKVVIYSEPNEENSERFCEVVVTMGNKSHKVKITNASAPEKLEPSAKSISFPSQGETHSIEIQANTDWQVKDVPGWVVSSKEAGTITLTALANENNVERQADIKIEGSSKTVVINVYQGAGLDKLAFSKNDIHFGEDGGDEYINVYTDAADWQLGGFPYWCQVTKVADNLLKVHCTPNEPNDLNREASVNVTTGKQMLGINVSQDAKPMVHIIPQDGIGGRAISFGFSAGYVAPIISTSAGSGYVYSPVNYTLEGGNGEASYTSSGGFSVSAFVDMRLYKNLYLTAGLEYTHYKYENIFKADIENRVFPQTNTFYLKGTTQNSFEEEYSMDLVEIPILASYRIPLTNKSHIRINAGPVISYGVSCNMKLSGRSDSESLKAYKIVNDKMTDKPYNLGTYSSHLAYSGDFNMYGKSVDWSFTNATGNTGSEYYKDDFTASPYKRLNFGLRLGTGFEYMGVSVNVSYQYMLSNMADSKFWAGDRWKIFEHSADLMSGYTQNNHYFMATIGYTFRY